MRVMVEFRFKPEDGPAIMALVPQEQAHIQTLRTQGLLEALYLGSDRTRGWIVMSGATVAEVQQRVESLPLHPYMQTEFTPLV